MLDAYSAFASPNSPEPDPARNEPSPLADYLRSHGIARLYVVGLATDYCVRASALAAHQHGFETIVLEDAIRAVGGIDATRATLDELRQRGIACTSISQAFA